MGESNIMSGKNHLVLFFLTKDYVFINLGKHKYQPFKTKQRCEKAAKVYFKRARFPPIQSAE